MAETRYITVQFSRTDDKRQWRAQAVDLPDLHATGRTLRIARRRIQDTAARCFPSESVQLIETVALAPEIQQRLERLRAARAQLAALERFIHSERVEVAHLLLGTQLTAIETARALDMGAPQLHNLLASAAKRRGTRARSAQP